MKFELYKLTQKPHTHTNKHTLLKIRSDTYVVISLNEWEFYHYSSQNEYTLERFAYGKDFKTIFDTL